MTLKTLKSTLLILLMLMSIPLAHAQENVNFQERLRNIGAFLATFVDLDNSTNYLADSIIQNNCKKRDLFALHDQKDTIGNAMLDNYRTLTETQLEDLKQRYALTDSELTFIRNIELDDKDLSVTVIQRANRDYVDDIRDELDNWLERYADRRGLKGEYANCPKAWDSVVQKWQSLSETLNEISTNWQLLKTQFSQTSQELLNTPGGFVTNTARTIEEGAVSSYKQTRQNIEREANELLRRNARDNLDEEEAYEKTVKETLGKVTSRQPLSRILDEETNLVEVVRILREQEQVASSQEAQAIDSAAAITTHSFTDNATFVLWNNLLELNETLDETNTTMGADEVGLDSVAREIRGRQCRV